MTWIKSHKRTACMVLAIIGGIIFLVIPKCKEVSKTEYSKPIPATKIDSVAKYYKQPEVKPNLIPSKKKVYKKKDTVLRKEAEKKDIILDIKLADNHIIETIIDTSGQVSENTLDIPIQLKEHKELVIVPEGVEVKKRKKLRAWVDRAVKNGKTVLIVIGGVTVIVLVAVVAGG